MTAGQWKLLIARLGLWGQGGVWQPTGQVDGHLAGLVVAWWRRGVTPLSESWSGALIFSCTGAPLGDMPDPRDIRHLGLPIAADGPTVDAGTAAVQPPPSTEGTGAWGGTNGGTSGGAGEKPVEKPVEKPFILSEGLPPVPHKLASKILWGEYIDMAELLRDNLEAQRRAATTAAATPHPSSTPKSRREVPDILSWVQCFGIYMAVVTSKCPERTKELLAYQTLIVREARRCGGKGWLAYDTHFRQQVVGNQSADWSKLNQSLYAVTFVAQGEREKCKNCMLCLESDHTEEQCALYVPPQKAPKLANPGRRSANDQTSAESSMSRSRSGSRMACFAWNQGECRFPACKYRHVCVCALCGGSPGTTLPVVKE